MGSVSAFCRTALNCFRLDHTTARGTVPPQHAVDHRGGAAHSGRNLNGFGRAILGARTTLHARIPVHDVCPLAVHAQHRVRADHGAHATADALGLVELQSGDILEIDQSIHERELLQAISLEAIQRPNPVTPATISNGKAQRISFLTPERDVYVDAPVKFMAR